MASRFRDDFYDCVTTRRDVLFELTDASLCAGSPATTVAIQQQARQFDNNIDLIASGAFISLIIPLVVFFAFQRQFVSGVMAGAVK